MGGAKECSTGVLDSIFSYLYTSTMRIEVTTSSSPTSLAGASSNSTGCLVHSTVGGFPTTDYFTLGSSGNNRYCTISACSCDSVLQTGMAACVILFNVSCSEVSYVTTCTTQDLTSGNKANIGTWTITVNQPS